MGPTPGLFPDPAARCWLDLTASIPVVLNSESVVAAFAAAVLACFRDMWRCLDPGDSVAESPGTPALYSTWRCAAVVRSW